MIMITVTGNTYPMKETLKSQGFQWNPDKYCWWKMVGVSLNETIENIRPTVDKLLVTLTHVDASGFQLSDKVLRITLKPGGERDATDFYAEFQNGICDDDQVITNNKESASPPVPEEKKKPRHVDPGFF